MKSGLLSLGMALLMAAAAQAAALAAQASSPPEAMPAGDSRQPRITLAHGSEAESRTQAQLRRLWTQHQLVRWTYTAMVRIDETAIPHSHPVLTLHTRHLQDDALLVSTFVHEQLHWWLAQNAQQADEAVAELRTLYPDMPVGYPRGSSDADGNYYHLIVIYLEQRVLARALGELAAQQVMEFWARDHYTWLYREILDRPGNVAGVVRKHRLAPPP